MGAENAEKRKDGRKENMELEIVYLSPHELTPYEGNSRKHAPKDIEQIKESILKDGFNDPIGIWGKQNIIVEGHGRQLAAIELGLEKVPCIRLDHLTDTQRRDYAIRHNRTAELSEWDFSKLEEEIARLEIEGVDLSGLEFELEGLEEFENEKDSTDERKGSMAEKYLVPPFSVIYTNKPDWLARKRAWVGLGLHSEVGRGGNLLTIQGAIQRQTSYGEIKQTHNKANAFSGGAT